MSIRDNRSAREEKLSGGLRVAELVKVVRFNAESMTVDAQPLVKVSIDGTMANQPQLTGVPVAGLCMGVLSSAHGTRRAILAWSLSAIRI